MAKQTTKNWREIRGQRPLNEDRVAAYRRLMQSERQLAEDAHLSTLAREIADLGGHLEVLAVFPDETVTLLCEPDEPGPGGASGLRPAVE